VETSYANKATLVHDTLARTLFPMVEPRKPPSYKTPDLKITGYYHKRPLVLTMAAAGRRNPSPQRPVASAPRRRLLAKVGAAEAVAAVGPEDGEQVLHLRAPPTP
jgi:hypothetical protein